MRSGDMRQRVQIQSFTGEAQDTTGDTTPSWLDDTKWTTLATRWACVEGLQGREWFEARQEVAEVTHRIRMRYLASVTPRMRIVWGSKTLQIKSATDPDGRKRQLVIMAQELIP